MTKSVIYGLLFGLLFITLDPQQVLAQQPYESGPDFEAMPLETVSGQPLAFLNAPQTPIPEVPNEEGPFIDVDAGNTMVCALRKDKTIRCWGMDDLGQASPPKGKFKKISLGDVHGCGLTLGGELRCWGGPLGRPKNEKKLGRFIKILAADGHTCALRTDHTAKCWGTNLSPTLTSPKGKFKTGDARSDYSCGVRMDDSLDCWGGSSLSQFELPKGRFAQVALGLTHACALRLEDRSVVCWGNNLHGEADAPSGSFVELASGDFHTCGRREDGGVLCWGKNQFGQLDLPPGLYRKISAGGASTCGLLMEGNFRCVGSYANNDFLIQRSTPPQPLSKEGQSAKFLPFAFLSQLASLTGAGLVNYGKGVDQKWDKQESKNIRWQLGLTVLGAIFSGFGTFLSQPDPTREMLKSIIDSLEQLSQAITRVEQQLSQVKAMIAATNCNVTLQNLERDKNIIENLWKNDYLILLNEAKRDLAAYTQGLATVDPSVKIQRFINNGTTERDIQGAMLGIHNALMGSTLESPLDACVKKDYLNWKAVAKHPFDDRHFYKTTYSQLYAAQSAQSFGLMMLQDINAWKAQQSLVAPGNSPTDVKLGQLDGLCAEIRSRANDPNPRWREAMDYCDRNTQRVQATYKDLVREIERAGAPYTDDHLVMSVSGTLFDGTSSSNWLWLRDISDQPESLIRGHHGTWQMQGAFINRGNANLYFVGDESKAATWRSDGRAWQELFDNYQAYRNRIYPDKAKAPEEDLLETLAGLTDDFGDPKSPRKLFGGIAGKPFWMTLKTFKMNWDVLFFDPLSANPASSDNLGCFMAGGINKTDKTGFTLKASSGGKPLDVTYSQRGKAEWTPLTGKVCSDKELARTTYSSWGFRAPKHFLSTTPMPYQDNLCGGQYPEYFCLGNGWPEGSSKNYQPYVQYLGNFDVRYRDNGGTRNKKKWLDIRKQAFFWPGEFGYLYRMPVLDLNARECLTSVADPGTKRLAAKTVDSGKSVPTRCGADLDSVIQSMVPRPVVPPMTDVRIIP